MIKSIIKGSGSIMAFKVFGAASTFGINVFISRVYGPEILGEYNLLFALIAFSTIFTRLGLDLYFLRKIPEYINKKEKLLGFLKASFQYAIIASIIAGLIIIIGHEFIDKYLFEGINVKNALLLIAPTLIFLTLFQLLTNIFRGFNNVFKFSFLQNLLLPGLTILFFIIFNFVVKSKVSPIYFYMASILFSFITGSILLFTFLKGKIKLKSQEFFAAIYKSDIIKYSFPMVMTSSSIYLMSYLDSFLISYYLDVRSVGLYSAIVKVSVLLSFLTTSISGFLAPKIAKEYLAKRFDQVKLMYRNTILILIAGGVPLLLLFLIFPQFFLGLFGSEFTSEVTTFNIYNVSVFIGATLFGPIGYFLVMTDNQKFFRNIILGALLSNIVINLILIPKFGLVGAAVTSLISTVLWKSLGYFRLKRKGIL
jgi:O-antigen/teichoic acid export membrane protein